MADTKISALTDGTSLQSTDRIPIARSPFGSGDNRYLLGSAFAASAPGAISGLRLSNNGTDAVNDIDFTAGACVSDVFTDSLALSATHVKQIDVTFAEYSSIGTASGGRDSADNLTGAKWFRVYLIGGSGKNTQAFFSTSASPTLPTGFTFKRRIGFLYWSGSTITAFRQSDRWFRWSAPPLDVNTGTLGTSATTYALTLPPYETEIELNVFASAASAPLVYLSNDITDSAPSSTAAPLAHFGPYGAAGQPMNVSTFCDASGQIRARSSVASTTLRVATIGWFDGGA